LNPSKKTAKIITATRACGSQRLQIQGRYPAPNQRELQ
jgi:hypothetical protein